MRVEVVLAVVCWAFAAGASDPQDGHAGHDPHARHAAAEEAAPASEHSIFQLASRWTLPDGREVPLSVLGGRVQVIAMIYTHCEHACPRIIADMRRIARELGPEGDRVGYALVSLDPERDDPERLAAFAEKTGLQGWTLMRAEQGAVRELAAALGIRFRRISDSDFIHTNLLSVLDPDGVVVHRQMGLGVDPTATVSARGEGPEPGCF
jgi:protein SCO1/2